MKKPREEISGKPMLAVSACLLGVACRYDGTSKPMIGVRNLEKDFRILPVCPEVLGGLPTPREPCEILGDRVIDRTGKDVTEVFLTGAEKTLALIRQNRCVAALLKERSPSCGTGRVHNGLFDGGLTDGNGIAADLLKRNGIPVFGESEIGKIKELLKGINL